MNLFSLSLPNSPSQHLHLLQSAAKIFAAQFPNPFLIILYLAGMARKVQKKVAASGNATKTAKQHKKDKPKLTRTRTMGETAQEGKAFVRKVNRKKAPEARRKKTIRKSLKKEQKKAEEKPKTVVEPAPAPVQPPKSPEKKLVDKKKTPKRHVKAKPKLTRTRTIAETIKTGNSFVGKKEKNVKAKLSRTKTMQETIKSGNSFLGKKDEEEKPKLKRSSTIQQTVAASKSILKKKTKKAKK
jgi:hypothetical protein